MGGKRKEGGEEGEWWSLPFSTWREAHPTLKRGQRTLGWKDGKVP